MSDPETHTTLARAKLLGELGDRPGAGTLLDQAEARCDQALRGEIQLLRGVLLLRAGKLEAAAAALEQADRSSTAAGRSEIASAARWYLAYHAALRGDLPAARGLADQAGGSGELPLEHRVLPLVVVGLLASGEQAREHWKQALDLARRLDLPEWIWRIEHALGWSWRAAGGEEQAQEHLGRATATLQGIARQLPPAWRERYLADAERRAVLTDGPAVTASASATASEVRLRGFAAGASAARDRRTPTPSPGGGRTGTEAPVGAPEGQRLLGLLTDLLGSEMDHERLFELILSLLIEATRAERGFLVRVDMDGQLLPQAARNFDRDEIQRPEGKLSTTLVREVLRTGRPLLLGEAARDGRYGAAPSVDALGLESVLVVPIAHRDIVRGVVYLDNRFARHHFDQADVDLATEFAQRCAPLFAHMLAHAQTARELEKVRQLYQDAHRKLSEEHRFVNIVARSESMRELLRLLEKVAASDQAVLIWGESGTGKELLARAVHSAGRRKDGPFLAENCAALSETLLESELFGHVRGAFTGAVDDKPGLFRQADGGSFFLDELTEMTPALQKKLLRVLDEGLVRPVGSEIPQRVDLRFIATTNRDPRAAMEAGEFLPDLYYRIGVLHLAVPPLRERVEDIPALLEHFARAAAERHGREPLVFGQDALAALLRHPWPGNVRELRNLVERLTVLGAGSPVSAEDLPWAAEAVPSGPGPVAAYFELPFQEARKQFITAYIRRALTKHGGNVSRAAESMGMQRASLHQTMFRYGIKARDHAGKPTDEDPS